MRNKPPPPTCTSPMVNVIVTRVRLPVYSGSGLELPSRPIVRSTCRIPQPLPYRAAAKRSQFDKGVRRQKACRLEGSKLKKRLGSRFRESGNIPGTFTMPGNGTVRVELVQAAEGGLRPELNY